MILHAGLIALRRDGHWSGVLIEGPSGAGKSDLALRALDAGFALVADDRVVVWASGGRLYGRAPGPLGGLIEVRGLGVVAERAVAFARIDLVARCVTETGDIERMPENSTISIEGLEIPRLDVAPLHASTPAKIGRALLRLGAGRQQAYQAAPRGPGGRVETGEAA